MVQFRLKKAEQALHPRLEPGPAPASAPLCTHKLPSAYCAVRDDGSCLRCESCPVCARPAGPAADAPLSVLLGVFEIVSACPVVIDYFAAERPKKAGRRR